MSATEKLTKLQQEFKAPKDKINTFGDYKYRSFESMCEAVKPLLDKYGLSMFVSDDVLQIGDDNYVKATVSLCDNESGGVIDVSALAREAKEKKKLDAPQITGTASSYARKYALNGLLLVDDTKDPDTDEYQREKAARSKARTKQKEESKEELKEESKDDYIAAMRERVTEDLTQDKPEMTKDEPEMTKDEPNLTKDGMISSIRAELAVRNIPEEYACGLYILVSLDKASENQLNNMMEHYDDIEEKWKEQNHE